MSNFKRPMNNDNNVRFSTAMFSKAEHSRMISTPSCLTTFNAGDIVPIYCREILPHESLKIDVDFVIRQTTLLTPTMGSMDVDIYAFFVPNRVVNQSWKAVMGENYNGSWTANKVSLATLVGRSTGDLQIPVGSVADYYGFPTQQPMPNEVLSLCHDLKFRGYVMIYNEFFRDQNYQPPIPLSTLNVYEGFFEPVGRDIPLTSEGTGGVALGPSVVSDGSYGAGAVSSALYGSQSASANFSVSARVNGFCALDKPLKANKLHDYFTSVLPSPQKSNETVFAPASGTVGALPVVTANVANDNTGIPMLFQLTDGSDVPSSRAVGLASPVNGSNALSVGSSTSESFTQGLVPTNLFTSDSAVVTGIGLSVDDLRMASAIQQCYEIFARGGTRYREIVQSFFGITADDSYKDIPSCLGHIRRSLDLFQTAQTSESSSGGTPQGNLAAFGYTSSGGFLFEHSFLEHGYVHIFAVVRHRNIYGSYFARDNFRLNSFDYYFPPLANISEQPVYTREINPFAPRPNDAFGYQEAWAEYRFEPDMVTGMMRNSKSENLSLWNYSDDFDPTLQISDGAWLKSNSEAVLNRTLAVTSSLAPQFKAQFKFVVDKDLPMPTYSVPGMDII